MSQIALPFSKPAQERPERIVIGNGNAGVADALANSENWPFRTAVLVGPARSGKSILAQWFASHTGGGALDDADLREEDEVFHAWNRAQEDGYPLLLTVSGQKWTIALPDLASRIGSALQLAIAQPDDAMAADLLEAHASQLGLPIGEGAAPYLVPRMERSYAAIEEIVLAIDRLCLERKAPATMSVWRDALETVQGPKQGRLL
ncbi:MAG: ATPase [Citromicrobium sp.]|nr:MAG: ATPase [Citromicrobium sp.]